MEAVELTCLCGASLKCQGTAEFVRMVHGTWTVEHNKCRRAWEDTLYERAGTVPDEPDRPAGRGIGES